MRLIDIVGSLMILLQNDVSSSSSGISIMVTLCPLSTAWALAASCPMAFLVRAIAHPTVLVL